MDSGLRLASDKLFDASKCNNFNLRFAIQRNCASLLESNHHTHVGVQSVMDAASG